MASLSKSLEQLGRHVKYTATYLRQYYDNLRLEAQHGFTDNPTWYLTEEARNAYGTYGELLSMALNEFVSTVPGAPTKLELIRRVRRHARRLRQWLNEREEEPGFPALTSKEHAQWEVLDVLAEILQGRLYIPKTFRSWNTPSINRWYHAPYIPDEGAIDGSVYWVNSQTRLVLYKDKLQLRWMVGRVLLDLPYQSTSLVNSMVRRGKESWRFILRDGREYDVNVSWVGDLEALKSELLGHGVEFRG